MPGSTVDKSSVSVRQPVERLALSSGIRSSEMGWQSLDLDRTSRGWLMYSSRLRPSEMSLS